MYEDATPEIVRDFFWDDEFRLRWDDMLGDATTLDECPTTGTMVVQWIKKVSLANSLLYILTGSTFVSILLIDKDSPLHMIKLFVSALLSICSSRSSVKTGNT